MFQEFVPNEPRALGFVVETNSARAFLEEEPLTLMLTGRFKQVPFMTGYTSGEGMIFEILPREIVDFQDVVPWSFEYRRDAPETKIVADKIKKLYFGDDTPSKNISKKYDVSTWMSFRSSSNSNMFYGSWCPTVKSSTVCTSLC